MTQGAPIIPPAPPPRQGSGPGRITALYLLVGTAWILGSDHLLDWLVPLRSTLVGVQLGKGLLFVLATTLMLHLLMRRKLAQIRRTERAQAESELRYQDFYRRTLDGVLVTRRDGTILDINPGGLAIFGYDSREELVGLNIEQCIYEQSAQRREILEKIDLVGSVDRHRVAVRRKDGRRRQVEISAAPILDAQGKIEGYRSLFHDVTDEIQAKEALAAEKELLSTTLSSIGDAVLSTDTEGRIVLFNAQAEQVTGWPADEAVGRPLADVLRLTHERSDEPASDPVREVVESTEAPGCVLVRRLLGRDGRSRLIEYSGAPIRGAGETLVGVVLVLRDIQARRRLEDEAIRASKLESVGVLAGGIAHDFNNILTAILGNLSLARMHLDDLERANRLLNEAERACMRARDLTVQLLTFSKGGVPILRVTTLEDLLTSTTRFALAGSAVKPEYGLQAGLWPVEVDVGQISQVLHNIVLNAQQAMPDGGRVRVEASNVELAAQQVAHLPAGRYVRVAVIDHGIGIPREHLDRIFDPYFTTKAQGTGLGLATSYSILRKHGGAIEVESQPGEGTTFRLYLPASSLPPNADRSGEVQPVMGRGRVLVMDDEEIVREVAARILARLGYGCATASNGEEALDLWQRARTEGRPFDAVLLDLTIRGGMGGRETLQRLRQLDPQVRAIVSSGYSNDPVMVEPAAHGFSGVVSKPYRVEEMSRVLQQVIGLH